MAKIEKKSLDSPDETRKFGNGSINITKIGDVTLGRATFEPGWKWSNDVKPIAKTDSCQVLHTMLVLSGKMHVVADDGTEEDFGPGDVGVIQPGHDAWVVGDEPLVSVDVT